MPSSVCLARTWPASKQFTIELIRGKFHLFNNLAVGGASLRFGLAFSPSRER